MDTHEVGDSCPKTPRCVIIVVARPRRGSGTGDDNIGCAGDDDFSIITKIHFHSGGSRERPVAVQGFPCGIKTTSVRNTRSGTIRAHYTFVYRPPPSDNLLYRTHALR